MMGVVILERETPPLLQVAMYPSLSYRGGEFPDNLYSILIDSPPPPSLFIVLFRRSWFILR